MKNNCTRINSRKRYGVSTTIEDKSAEKVQGRDFDIIEKMNVKCTSRLLRNFILQVRIWLKEVRKKIYVTCIWCFDGTIETYRPWIYCSSRKQCWSWPQSNNQNLTSTRETPYSNQQWNGRQQAANLTWNNPTDNYVSSSYRRVVLDAICSWICMQVQQIKCTQLLLWVHSTQ